MSAAVAERRAAEGLPPTITDVAVLSRVATILASATNGKQVPSARDYDV
jgi:hypothetical protein